MWLHLVELSLVKPRPFVSRLTHTPSNLPTFPGCPQWALIIACLGLLFSIGIEGNWCSKWQALWRGQRGPRARDLPGSQSIKAGTRQGAGAGAGPGGWRPDRAPPLAGGPTPEAGTLPSAVPQLGGGNHHPGVTPAPSPFVEQSAV